MIRKYYAIVGALGLFSCHAHNAQPAVDSKFTLYETPDRVNALYVIDGRFVFGRSMEPSKGLSDFLRERAAPIERDKYDCQRIGPLIIPKNLKEPRCDGVSFSVRDTGALVTLTNSCETKKNHLCTVQRYDASGSLVNFQFVPDEPVSEPYIHISGPILAIGG